MQYDLQCWDVCPSLYGLDCLPSHSDFPCKLHLRPLRLRNVRR